MFTTRRLKSELSVFFALSAVLVAALLLGTVESARTEAARAYLTIAANSAADSLYSQYHRGLWEKYRLLGLEMYGEKEFLSETAGFLQPYFSEETARNWYLLSLREEDILVTDRTLITDQNAQVFEKEVLDYMKYGIAVPVPEPEEAEETIKMFQEGIAVTHVSESFAECSGIALRMNERILGIGSLKKEHDREYAELCTAVSERSAKAVSDRAGTLTELLSRMEEEAFSYEILVSEMKDAVSRAGERLEEKRASGELTEESFQSLSEELSEYRSLCESESGTAAEIAVLPPVAEKNQAVLEKTAELSESAEAYIENFTPEKVIMGYGPPAEEGGEPVPIYGETYIDEAEIWEPATKELGLYTAVRFTASGGEPDEEKKEKLEKVSEALRGELLSMVLPEGARPEETPLSLAGCPSRKFSSEEESGHADLSASVFVAEYVLKVLPDFLTDRNRPETEYVLYGKESDKENLSSAAEELLAIRTGMNLLYLLSDSEKRGEARTLALSIAGAAALTPVSIALMFLILSTWAAAQGVLDVRDLFAGEKVPLMHSRDSFYLSIGGLIEDFAGMLHTAHHGEKGMDYRAWLRVLLTLHLCPEGEYRIMDMIQADLRKTQADFLMERLTVSSELMITAMSGHLFSEILTPGHAGGRYPVSVVTYYSY